ncbi:MAG: BACON domain-containing protein [Prevotella sp.]
MKLKYFVPMFIMALAMLTSCSDDEVVTYPGDIRVSSSYMALPVEGGSTSIDVYCNQKWEVDTVGAFPKKEPWFDYSVSSSDKGQLLTITAEAALDGRSTTIKLVTEGGTTQYVNVMQGLSTVSTATCAEVIAGPDSKTYRVKGVCTGIANTTYGNWYLNDGTGEIYIYGTLDKNGATKNFLSLGIEVGDEITVEGPKLTYGSTVELVDVTVVAINKSLIKVDSTYVAGEPGNTLPLEGGELTAYVTCKGNGVTVDIPDDAKEWLSIAAFRNGGSEVVFRATPNTGGDRNATVVFTTTDGKKEYSSQMAISQKGAIVEKTVAEFNEAPVGDAQYRITGIVSSVYNASKGRFYIKDYTGELYVYNMSDFEATGIKDGDIVTLVGKRDEYNGTIEMVSAYVEDIKSVKTVTIDEFRNLPDDKEAYYMISGIVGAPTEDNTKYDLTQYGNFNLTDSTGSVYIYGVYRGWGDSKGNFGELGVQEGETLTIVAYKTSYKGLIEGVGYYFSSSGSIK